MKMIHISFAFRFLFTLLPIKPLITGKENYFCSPSLGLCTQPSVAFNILSEFFHTIRFRVRRIAKLERCTSLITYNSEARGNFVG